MKLTIETNNDTGERSLDIDGVVKSRSQINDLISMLQFLSWQVFPGPEDVAPMPSPPPSFDDPMFAEVGPPKRDMPL